MKTTRIYQAGHYEPGQTISLSPTAAQHVGLVLRMAVGEQLTLFRGDNIEFKATICEAHKKHIAVHINNMQHVNRESPRQIHLAQALVKGDKMEWIIQKAVELGVTSITPILSERSVVRLDKDRLEKKQHQWQAIAISACEQSGRNYLPILHPTCALDQYLDLYPNVTNFILSPQATNTWPPIKATTRALALLIGPEGGFSDTEVMQATKQNAHPISLGPRILRTETAAIATLSIMQQMYGDL